MDPPPGVPPNDNNPSGSNVGHANRKHLIWALALVVLGLIVASAVVLAVVLTNNSSSSSSTTNNDDDNAPSPSVINSNSNAPTPVLPSTNAPTNFVQSTNAPTNTPIPFIPDLPAFQDEDPFNNVDPENINVWRTSGQGLELTVINALEEHWHEFFDTAVSQWDNGTPDALTLAVTYEEAQAVCQAQNGVLKVCNGNYGDTNWHGINKVLLENGWIYSSAVRMNEYYLTRNYDRDFPRMAYTMCHEFGHAFGLPHTDENTYNTDLGNCMDYTNNPENNMQPDSSNFEFLTQLYGTVDSGTTRRRRAAAARRNEIPWSVQAAFHDVDHLVDDQTMITDDDVGRDGEGSKWRKLHESQNGETHEMDLGGGFKAVIHWLKVLPQD